MAAAHGKASASFRFWPGLSGDRLPLVPKHASKASSPVVTTLSRPPIGCESAFSLAADPKRSHVFAAEFRDAQRDERMLN
jgi:hypothetical protein